MHRAEAHPVGRHGHSEEFLWSAHQWPGHDKWHPAAGTDDKVAPDSDSYDSAADDIEQRPERRHAQRNDEFVAVQEADAEFAGSHNESTAERSPGGALSGGDAKTGAQHEHGGAESGDGELGGFDEGLERNHGQRV